VVKIDLVDKTASLKHVSFRVLPVARPRDFTCNPAGVLPFDTVVRISRKLYAGKVFGRVGQFLWYRLING
jgi:hypothetical protein